MKTKSKLVVALSALLAVSAGAVTTGTFAWFNTTKTGTVNFQKFTAEKTGNIELGYLPMADSFNSVTADNGSSTSAVKVKGKTSGVSKVQDVSTSDAKTFYQPIWSTFGDTATSIPEVKNTTNQGYYVQFGISIKNTDTTNPMAVYLDAGSSIAAATETAASDKCASMATRVAINKATKTADADTISTVGDNVIVWQYQDNYKYTGTGDGQETVETTYNRLEHVDGTTTANRAYNDVNYDADDIQMTTFTEGTKFHAGKFSAITTLTTANDYAKVGESITAGGTSYFVVTIWLEGTSKYCADADTTSTSAGAATHEEWAALNPMLAAGAVGGSVQTTLQFAGLITAA